tara:strand:- start:89 stop:373 length:285 start_codon:yes stop_codon:yes gene_type:complete
MATYKDRVVKSVTHYEPGPLPTDDRNLGIYVSTELKRLGDILFNQATFRLERTHEAPTRPRGGDIRYADGSNWNPGSGEGIYFFKESTTAWVKL